MSADKMREEFEAWARDNAMLLFVKTATGKYSSEKTELAWQAWRASRAALVVELPDPHQTAKRYMADEAKFAHKEGIDECRAALEAAGARVKP